MPWHRWPNACAGRPRRADGASALAGLSAGRGGVVQAQTQQQQAAMGLEAQRQRIPPRSRRFGCGAVFIHNDSTVPDFDEAGTPGRGHIVRR